VAPLDTSELDFEVLATERRAVAVSSQHPLALRQSVEFAEIVEEPITALPASAAPVRDFWLATDQRAGKPARVAAEVATADETFEILSASTAVTLLAEGNAAVYSRSGVACIPVSDLDPARLAAAWPRSDRRPAVQAFIRACHDAALDVGQH
jgi:DNA-binding transcriptional LysR family regulator